MRTLVQDKVQELFPDGDVPVPGQRSFDRLIDEVGRGRAAVGPAKRRRDVADSPAGPYRTTVATRPGEYVLLDSTPLDVFAPDLHSGQWVQLELTIALDLFTRSLVAWRFLPGTSRPSAEHFSWTFRLLHGEPKYGADTIQDWGYLLSKLQAFENMTTSSLFAGGTAPGKDYSNLEDMPNRWARNRLQTQYDDFTMVSRFRLSNLERLYGIRTGNVFSVLWWDPRHEIRPPARR